MLAAFGLAGLHDRYPRDLSSGERQRAALAATLAGSPSLVLLDEPTRGMDAAARRSLAAAVRSLTEGGSAVVLATHDTELAAELADRTIALAGGRAVELPRAAFAPPTAAPAVPEAFR
jgi:energy-coupling factor transport system ATP-binding protein